MAWRTTRLPRNWTNEIDICDLIKSRYTVVDNTEVNSSRISLGTDTSHSYHLQQINITTIASPNIASIVFVCD
jgi:hypothetical protein